MMRKPELTIAPLIDCIFLLLLFFAVSTNLLREVGMPISKPKAKKSIQLPRDVFVITITKDERIFLGKEETLLEALSLKINERLLENPNISFIIAADKEVRCRRLIEVLDLCKEKGAKNLAIATIPK